MILTEVRQEEGLNFTIDVKLVPPFEYRYGARIERVDEKLLANSPEFKLILTALGFKKVGLDEDSPCYIYVQKPFRYIQYQIGRFMVLGYLRAVRWLYYNARIFQQIPPGYRFSWSYFTPFVWAKKLKAKIARI